jgi:hypothetical protein
MPVKLEKIMGAKSGLKPIDKSQEMDFVSNELIELHQRSSLWVQLLNSVWWTISFFLIPLPRLDQINNPAA